MEVLCRKIFGTKSKFGSIGKHCYWATLLTEPRIKRQKILKQNLKGLGKIQGDAISLKEHAEPCRRGVPFPTIFSFLSFIFYEPLTTLGLQGWSSQMCGIFNKKGWYIIICHFINSNFKSHKQHYYLIFRTTIIWK